jgi:hypothetical protein
MMALLTASYCANNPQADALNAARYYAYTLAKGFVPESSQAAFAKLFHSVDSLPRAEVKQSENMLITATNEPAFTALCDVLQLRALRQSQGIQAGGGLGGIILEGEPGLGKTQLIINTLVAQGMKKASLTKEHRGEPVFYVIPVSMAYSEKENLLLRAFHEGAVVFIDEINSAPMMERLLNDLLMGKDPQGNSAKIPGFMVIGAQNPASMAGRIRASTALEHRMQKVILSEYSQEEMVKILEHKGLPVEISQDMVAEYVSLRHKALQDSTPALCFRDLLKRAEQEITACSKGKLPPVILKPEEQKFHNKQNDQQQHFAEKPEEQSKKQITLELKEAGVMEQEFNNNLHLLEKKKQQFYTSLEEGKEELRKAYEAAEALHKELHNAGQAYFAQEPDLDRYKKFKETCEQSIKVHRPELDKHRGCAKIIVNIFAIILTLGVGYGIALGIGKLINGSKFSFFSTNSTEKINLIEDSIEKADPKKPI